MDNQLAIAIAIGCVASVGMNVGKGIQKMKVVVWKTWPRVLAPENRRNFSIWLTGMLMTAAAGALFTKALSQAQPSIIASLNGVGIIALAIFSSFVLREKVGFREWSAIGLIIAGTLVVQTMQRHAGLPMVFTLSALLWVVGLCFVVFVALVLVTMATNRGRAFVYAMIAGTCLALMFVFFKIANVEKGPGPLGEFFTIYFVIGFMCGNCAFLFTNLAFFHGTATMIVPAVNSFMILMPVLFEYLIFGATLRPVQYIGVVVIATGVVLLTTGQGHPAEMST